MILIDNYDSFTYNIVQYLQELGVKPKVFENDKISIEELKKINFKADLITNLNIVKNSKVLKEKWKSYSRKNSYAKDLSFDETIKCLEEFVKLIVVVAI